MALFPEGGARRIVLLSDGVETAGSAGDMVGRIRATGVQLSVVPMGQQSANEVSVDKVSSLASVPDGQEQEIRVILKSTSERAASVSLSDNKAPLGKQDVKLKAGSNVVSFNVKASGEGLHVYEAQVTSVDDHFAENNKASAFSVVRSAPSVLIVATSEDDSAPMKSALEANSIKVTTFRRMACPAAWIPLSNMMR